jgi:hypothetical protein
LALASGDAKEDIMRHIIKAALTTLVAFPMLAAAAPLDPGRWMDDHRVEQREVSGAPEPWHFTCSTGNATTLLAGAAVLGLLLRRKR